MKCIYCNTEENISESDIIPYSLTGAKVKKRFVCRPHNCFTNDSYEKSFITALGMFRNLLGLTERDGDPVRFVADIDFDGVIIKGVSISDKTSLFGNPKRKFSTKDENGKTIVVGDINEFKKFKGYDESKITHSDLRNVTLTSKVNIHDLFATSNTLHVMAKIAYEWHCYINNIESYIPEKYSDIVNYILSQDSTYSPVDLVVDARIWGMMDHFSHTGSNMIFEYEDAGGNVYVVFGFWDLIIYRVLIAKNSIQPKTPFSISNVYFYHSDETTSCTMFATEYKLELDVKSPDEGLPILVDEIKERLSKLGERDLTKEYLKKCIEKISVDLEKYKRNRVSFEKLMDFERQDKFVPIYILELISLHPDLINKEDSFTENLQRILKTEDYYVMTDAKKEEILIRYKEMHEQNKFSAFLERIFAFFKHTFLSVTE